MITLGDHMVGKTSILRRFQGNEFIFTTYTTIGIDFVTKDVAIGDGKNKVSVKIWDTAGQDRFHTITHSFYKQCQGVLLVFDVGSKKSFENIHKWMNNIQNHADKGIIKYLVGNKIDNPNREVTAAEAQQVATEYDMKYYETSARLNIQINECINALANDIYTKTLQEHGNSGFALNIPVNDSPHSGCCGG